MWRKHHLQCPRNTFLFVYIYIYIIVLYYIGRDYIYMCVCPGLEFKVTF